MTPCCRLQALFQLSLPWSSHLLTPSLVPSALCSCPHTCIAVRPPSLAVPQSPDLPHHFPGFLSCCFIEATKSQSHFPAARTEPGQLRTVTLPSSRCFPEGKIMGKLQVPGQPREGGRGTWHQPAQTYPAALAKHSLSFLQDFCHFPAKTPPHSRPQDCRAFNHTRGASRGVRQGGWRWLRSQIPTLPSVLEQGAHLNVTPRLSWSLPASKSPQSRTGWCPPTCVGSHSSLQGTSGERTSPVDPRPCCHQQMHHSPLRFSNPHLPESCA